jgi:hypothetical protein
MALNDSCKGFALDFLGQLTAAGIPYALQRNPKEIAAGTFKDIDLIGPRNSFARVMCVLRARADVETIAATHSFSRSQLTVNLLGAELGKVTIDLDYQITLIGDGLGRGRLAQMLARSVIFSDLKTCRRTEGAAEITFLKPEEELLLLRNHVRRKPKDIYLERIERLKACGVVPSAITPAFQRRGPNLIRRYILILRALPAWLGSRIQPWCEADQNGHAGRGSVVVGSVSGKEKPQRHENRETK